MKTSLKLLAVFFLPLMWASCREDSFYSGFKKMESGAYMKFYSRSDSKVLPRLKDEVTFEMAQYFNDTMLFTTVGDKPMSLVLQPADFVGDVADALLMMHVGDSAQLIVLSDSVFISTMNIDVPEQFSGKPIYYDLKLLSIKPFEILEEERKARLDSLKVVEKAFLQPLREDPKNTVTETGIIILEKTGRDRFAKLGDFVNFDFTVCKPSGDTVMNSFGVDAIEMQYGEEFLCKGFNTALGMVPVNGSMRFVIPSDIAFDSIGYQQYIDPYTPLVVRVKVNSVMDKEAYEKKQAELKAQQEAEKERRLKLQSQLIEDYVKSRNVTISPTESGLYIIPESEGTGELAKWGDVVSVQYVLCNLKEDILESSYDYDTPITFKIGNGEMIPGIEEALMTMAPGAKVRLIVPSELGFGEVTIDETYLPAYTPLLIDLELVSIK